MGVSGAMGMRSAQQPHALAFAAIAAHKQQGNRKWQQWARASSKRGQHRRRMGHQPVCVNIYAVEAAVTESAQ